MGILHGIFGRRYRACGQVDFKRWCTVYLGLTFRKKCISKIQFTEELKIYVMYDEHTNWQTVV